MKLVAPNEKQMSILVAAWGCFSAFGYQKTSMGDIAKAAGMSRPALYLQFTDKADIFAKMTTAKYYLSIREVFDVLTSDVPRDLADRLNAAFEMQKGKIMKELYASQHGPELLQTGMAMNADIVRQGELELQGVYSRWLAEEADKRNLALFADPDEIAGLISAALTGAQQTTGDYDAYRAKLAVFAKGLAAALRR